MRQKQHRQQHAPCAPRPALPGTLARRDCLLCHVASFFFLLLYVFSQLVRAAPSKGKMRGAVALYVCLIVAGAGAFVAPPLSSAGVGLRAGVDRAVRATGRARITLLAASALTTELKGELLQLVSAQDLSEDISSEVSRKMDALVERISATASGPFFSKEVVSQLRSARGNDEIVHTASLNCQRVRSLGASKR